MRIVLLGPPGSGKAELSKRIAEQYKIPIITQASVIDTAAAENSELGRLAAEARDASRVSDELLLALLRIQLPKMDLNKGYILVDMPKNSGQADVLDSVLNDLGRPIDLVLNLEVDPDDLMERLVGHIHCDACGTSYNMYVNPPMVDGVCDVCGARVSRRPNDYEETISNRLRVYDNQMGPLLQYYSMGDKLQRIDAAGDVSGFWNKIKAIVDATPSPQPVEAETAAKAEASIKQGKSAKIDAAPGKKKTAKKAPLKKAAAKKKGAAKSPAAAKTAAKKKVSKKTAAKKAATKKAAPKKKAAAKKPTTKRAATKKSPATKATAKKAVAKKASSKKVARKAPSKKATAAKTTAKKGTKKKVVSKKTTPKKTAKKKVVKKTRVTKAQVKKVASKKTTTRKAAPKKTPVKKVAKKKAPVKKAPAKKVAKKVAKKKVTKKKVAKRKESRR